MTTLLYYQCTVMYCIRLYVKLRTISNYISVSTSWQRRHTVERCREGKNCENWHIKLYAHTVCNYTYIAGVTYIPTHAVIHYIAHVCVCRTL